MSPKLLLLQHVIWFAEDLVITQEFCSFLTFAVFTQAVYHIRYCGKGAFANERLCLVWWYFAWTFGKVWRIPYCTWNKNGNNLCACKSNYTVSS